MPEQEIKSVGRFVPCLVNTGQDANGITREAWNIRDGETGMTALPMNVMEYNSASLIAAVLNQEWKKFLGNPW